jgi:hypothetical protein
MSITGRQLLHSIDNLALVTPGYNSTFSSSLSVIKAIAILYCAGSVWIFMCFLL